MDELDDVAGERVLRRAEVRARARFGLGGFNVALWQKCEKAKQTADVVVGAVEKVLKEVVRRRLCAVQPDSIAGALAKFGTGAVRHER